MSAHRHRRVALSHEDSLVLRCAVGEPREAQLAWLDLMSSVPFDEVSENAQRLMPAIYWNLRASQDVSERARMRGAFKHAWARNTRMLHDLLPALDALHSAGINYRLLKGIAIQLQGGHLGSRSMGDLDLLVSETDMKQTDEVLLSMGFRRNTMSGCERHTSLSGDGAVNFNRRESHVDVHAAERKFPSTLLTRMLSEPPRGVVFGKHTLLIPSPELLILHASVHGGQAVSPTDFVQAASDVSTLAPSANTDNLLRLARATKTLVPLLAMDAALKAAGVNTSGVRPRAADQWAARLRTDVARPFGTLRKLLRARKLVAERRLSQRAMQVVKQNFGAPSQRYRAWLRLGRFSATERALFRTSGFFLSEPTSTWPSGQAARVFADSDVRGVVASRVASSALDWRFRMRFDIDPRSIQVQLNAACMSDIDAYVYCDGVPVTRVVAGDAASREFAIVGAGRDIEISLRPTWSVCEECYPGFDDLLVTVKVYEAAPSSGVSSRSPGTT